MLKLHGTPISNFYCIAKQALQEKGIAFETVHVMANQEPDYLAKSPMGKIPALETGHGFLTETNVILEYLDAVYPGTPLYPAEPFARAKVQQLLKTVELYIEGPAHALTPSLFGKPLPDYLRDTTQPMMQRGMSALGRLATLSPWIAGEQFGAADIFAYRSLGLAIVMAKKFYDWDLLAEVEGLKEWHERMAQRPLTQAIDAEAQAATQAILKQTGRA